MTITAESPLRLFEVSLREAKVQFHVIAPEPETILAATVPAWGMRPQGPWPEGTQVVTAGALVTVRHPSMGVLARVTELTAQVLTEGVTPPPAPERAAFPAPVAVDAEPDVTGTVAAPGPVAALTVATDGACSGNPGPAGWAWVDQNGRWRSGGLTRSTNQVGELLGLLHAVRDHQHVVALTIEIDSTYAMNTYLQWMDAHVRRGWRTTAGKPTSNRDVIEQLIAARNVRAAAGLPPVRLVKVKGHANGRHPLNDAADHQATTASARARGRETGPWQGQLPGAPQSCEHMARAARIARGGAAG